MNINHPVELKFPFLGTLENGEPFEYLLLSIDTDTAEIALLNWFLNRLQLHIGDKIDLHLPQLFSTRYKIRNSITGNIMAAKHSEEDQGEIYRISLSEQRVDFQSFEEYANQLSSSESLIDLFIHLIKDSIILKAGISVYFKHLIPYFSRISDFSNKEYDKLKIYFLNDIELRITNHKNKLEEIYNNINNKIKKLEEIPIFIDLESVRELLESEISSSVFNVIFSREKVPDLSLCTYPQSGVIMYINAIKNLERRLYSNYNHIVIIYLKSIK